jgi:N-acetylmuramic acid 6-phosphate etherase
MLEKLLTEQRNPSSERIDAASTEDMLRIINREDQQVALAVERVIPAIGRAVDAIVAAMEKGGRLVYAGAGTSGRLGLLDAVECPPTFNVPPYLVQAILAGGFGAAGRAQESGEDDPAAGARDLGALGFSAKDVLVGIAASGRTPYVLGAIGAARGLGATTAGISCTPDSELAAAVDIAITPVTGPEVLTGSTRLKAGTATKLVLNMLSTGVMVRLGHVYGNLMVNVQPKNLKLEQRALRIISEITGVGVEQAGDLLAQSGRDVRTAVVMGRLRLSREEAEERLRRAGGHIRRALEGNWSTEDR